MITVTITDREYFEQRFNDLEKVIAVHDRLYTERDRAAKEAVQAALLAAERSAEKTEAALKEYKVGANEWRDTVKDLIGNLREAQSIEVGSKARGTSDQQRQQWVINLVLGLVTFAAGIVVTLLLYAASHPASIP